MPEAHPTDLRRPAIELLAASLVVLFQELALIRWLPVEVRAVAYFPNLILIGAFLMSGPAFAGLDQAPADADAWFMQDDMVASLSPTDD